MPGNAKTSSFLLSTATVMVGPMEDLHELNVDAHSIGLVKNFQMTADPQYVELTQGLRNSVVMSVRTADGVKASMEVFEFTPANLAYAAGLDGSGAGFEVVSTVFSLQTTAAAAATSLVVTGDVTDDIAVGDYLFVQKGESDYVHIVKVASAAFATNTTITLASGFSVPAGMSFPAGSRVGKLVKVAVGGQTVQPDFAMKVVGLLPKDNTPFTILFPKIKITRGLGVAFQSDNFSNLPVEVSPYSMVASDPLYAEYGDAVAILLAR